MFARITFPLALMFLSAGVFLGGTTPAEASVRVGPRLDWFYNGGNFHAVAGTGGGWVETINSNEAFYFRQSDRNDLYVELFDSSRNMYVRLYADAVYLKVPGDGAYRHLYYGQWDDRRLYNVPGAQPSYFSLQTASIWHWARVGLPVLYMREILRNDDQIQLYNGAEGITFSLLDNAVWMKKDGFAWFKYSNGNWN